jgi:hypothetical protein
VQGDGKQWYVRKWLWQSRRGHQHRERYLDELFIPVDRDQGAVHVFGDFCRTALLDLSTMMAASRAN